MFPAPCLPLPPPSNPAVSHIQDCYLLLLLVTSGVPNNLDLLPFLAGSIWPIPVWLAPCNDRRGSSCALPPLTMTVWDRTLGGKGLPNYPFRSRQDIAVRREPASLLECPSFFLLFLKHVNACAWIFKNVTKPGRRQHPCRLYNYFLTCTEMFSLLFCKSLIFHNFKKENRRTIKSNPDPPPNPAVKATTSNAVASLSNNPLHLLTSCLDVGKGVLPLFHWERWAGRGTSNLFLHLWP